MSPRSKDQLQVVTYRATMQFNASSIFTQKQRRI